MDWETFDFKKAKTMHSTKKRAMPVKSDEIRTMCSARTGWSAPKHLSGCSRPKDDTRLARNESALKRRRLRKENMALRRKISHIEMLLGIEGE